MSQTGVTAAPERGPSPESKPSRGLRSWPSRLALFFRQVIAELRKVVWPTRSQLLTYTIVVLNARGEGVPEPAQRACGSG